MRTNSECSYSIMDSNSSSNNTDDDKYGNSDRIESPSATYFNPQEAPPDQRQKYERLWNHNENLQKQGKYKNQKEVRRRERIQLFEVVASRLPLDDFQREQARSRLDSLDFSGTNVPLEVHLFVVCVMVYNRTLHESRQKYLPSESRDNPDEFEAVADNYNITQQEISQSFDKLYGEFYD